MSIWQFIYIFAFMLGMIAGACLAGGLVLWMLEVWYRRVERKWKIYATMPFPGFHRRNLASNAWLELMGEEDEECPSTE